MFGPVAVEVAEVVGEVAAECAGVEAVACAREVAVGCGPELAVAIAVQREAVAARRRCRGHLVFRVAPVAAPSQAVLLVLDRRTAVYQHPVVDPASAVGLALAASPAGRVARGPVSALVPAAQADDRVSAHCLAVAGLQPAICRTSLIYRRQAEGCPVRVVQRLDPLAQDSESPAELWQAVRPPHS